MPARRSGRGRPLRCGTGLPLSALSDGARQAIEGFRTFLAGNCAMVADTGEFVGLGRVGEPGVILVGWHADAPHPHTPTRQAPAGVCLLCRSPADDPIHTKEH